MLNLTEAQSNALKNITEYAKGRKKNAQDLIAHVLRMSNVAHETYEAAVEALKAHARIGLHFHPDRPGPDKKPVALALLEGGIYRSQFETGISNGGVSAHPGGARDEWERIIFHGAYSFENSDVTERPKYGALNLMLHPDGPSPRFGSCYFILKPEVSRRSTFTYLDSHQNPPEKGTYDEFDDIMAALLGEVFARDFGIGENGLMPDKLINHLITELPKTLSDPTDRMPSRNLNHYIEAQVHGEIRLNRDVETLVSDPSFDRVEIGKVLDAVCSQNGIKRFRHRGFRLSVKNVPDNFRGPNMRSLAERIALDGYVDASLIGEAVMDLHMNPDSWLDRGEEKNVLQELKLLWHCLVKYGR
jgi:hypothetical protein